MSVQRFAVKLRARRLAVALMLHQCPCGGIVSFNGLFDSRTTSPRNFADEADPISRQRSRFHDLSLVDNPDGSS